MDALAFPDFLNIGKEVFFNLLKLEFGREEIVGIVSFIL